MLWGELVWDACPTLTGGGASQAGSEYWCRQKKSKVVLLTCWITYRQALISISLPNTHTPLAASKTSISSRPAGLRATTPTFLCYLQRSPLTHLAAGLRCALSNNELCIRCCHFEKCNYLSDKADGLVLSGICCASIKSRVRWKTLSHTRKRGMWKLPCINSHKQAKSLRSL